MNTIREFREARLGFIFKMPPNDIRGNFELMRAITASQDHLSRVRREEVHRDSVLYASVSAMLSPEQRKQASRKLTNWLDNEKKIVSIDLRVYIDGN